MIPGGPGVSSAVTVRNIANATFNYSISTSCPGCNALWTDTVNGLQMAVDRGGLRDPNNPSSHGSGTNLYTGPVQVSNFAITPPLQPNQTDTLSVTIWLPRGAPASNPSALTPQPGNALQGMSIAIALNWSATQLATSTPVGS
jgi:hypothetical protein